MQKEYKIVEVSVTGEFEGYSYYEVYTRKTFFLFNIPLFKSMWEKFNYYSTYATLDKAEMAIQADIMFNSVRENRKVIKRIP